MSYSIKRRLTKKGIAYDLYYRWHGERYRPLLGYKLNVDEAERLAIDMIGKIHRGELRKAGNNAEEARLTFSSFLPTYWMTLRTHQRIDLRRPAIILKTHLVPRFGDRPLESLTAQDGLSYIAARLDAGATPGTVRKEWGVLMRILNLAIDFDKISRNRLKCVRLPEATKRERVASLEELRTIREHSDPYLWRIVEVALHTGLREGKILEIEHSWLKLRDDGWWLILPPARSALKRTPRELPLNRIAWEALHTNDASDSRSVFDRWTSDALNKAWARTSRRANVHNLHFHDLRHTFSTNLQNLGVPLEVRAALLGHSVRGESMTACYSHGGHGWNQQLRHALRRLELSLSYEMSYENYSIDSSLVTEDDKPRQTQEKGWWSQRDLNPCLSLERDGWRNLADWVIAA